MRHVTPTGAQAVAPFTGGISADHNYNFVFVQQFPKHTGTNGSLAQEGEADYLGDPSGNYELTGIGSLGVERLASGRYISPGGKHVIFTTGRLVVGSGWCFFSNEPPKFKCPVNKLEPDAPPTGTGAVYDRSADGPTHVVSLLPGNVTPAAGEDAIYEGASADGATVAFKIAGSLYLRVDNAKTEEVTSSPATFGGISANGSNLYYVSGGNIHRFDTATEADEEVNSSGDAQMVNASADGSHVYLISPSQLDGAKGTVGQPNLYVWSGGSAEYVATVEPSDTEGIPALTNWTSQAVAPPGEANHGPGGDSSRTTPDGRVMVFESKAELTPYDNAGRTEIYRYDDEDKSLQCVSCNPSGTPAVADARLQELDTLERSTVIHNLTADGERVFFETSEALVEEDLDNVNDVYEWQEPSGEGSQTVDLISSGHSTEYPQVSVRSPKPNVLMGVSVDGADVFFRSLEPLVAGAPVGGAPSIYDARVDGGFPPPPPSPAPCLDLSSCRPGATSPPALEGAGSESLNGAGNVKPKPRQHRRCKGHKHRKRAPRSCQRHQRAAAPQAFSSSQATGTPLGQAREDGAAAAPAAQEPRVGGTSISRALGPSTFASEFEGFGIESVAAEASTTAAAGHPDFTTKIFLSPIKTEVDPRAEDVVVDLPPGLIGNPNLLPRCKTGDLLGGDCPVDSQVGVTRIKLFKRPQFATLPLFNMAPVHPDQEIARLGLMAVVFPVFIDVSVDTAGDYGITAGAHDANGQEAIEATETTIWGDPADPSHDKLRMTIAEGSSCSSVCGGGERASTLEPFAFFSNPSACGQGEVAVNVTSYQLPGQLFSKSAPMAPITECEGLPFAPSFEAEPTSHVAGAPTGLETKLVIPQHLGAEEKSTATMREARVTLPAGMQVAAGAANWIGTCSDSEVGFHEEVDAQCPDNSKLGTATITSPAISTPIEGNVYQRSPSPGHQLGLWLVSDALGLHIKIPGELEPDPNTGRLVAVFRDLPQVPASEIDVNVWGGPRAPLQNPDHCGTFTTNYTMAPHSNDPAVTGSSTMAITEGCNQPFDPKLSAGVTNPTAAKYSPLIVDLTRQDGDQALRGFELELPDGQLAKLKGVPLCPDSAASSGSCPADSALGHVVAASGPGPEPLWVPQPGKPEPKVYLAGPYEGSPFSVVTEVPAQAGPFDLGTLAVRSGLGLNPDTNRALVKADPLPQYFEGVGLTYRRVHVVVDRPEFALNGTDCREGRFDSTMTSTLGTVAHPASRFQLEGCKALKFKPKLSIELRGGTKRADYPALTAVLKARKGDANIAKTSVALPHSEFLAQEHIVTICTRVQFTAHKCPKGSIYGKAKAWSPLLAKPLEGPVYLRSSDHPLPDLVVSLGGELDVNLVGRIDTDKAGGIRSTFEAVPDAPVTRFVLKMRGGAKGLLTNSADICAKKHRATVKMTAQNGKVHDFKPVLQAKCKGGKKAKRHHRRHGGGRR